MKLDNVYTYALEKFAGDQMKATEFVEGFAKEAGVWDSVKGAFTTRMLGKNDPRPDGFVPAMVEGLGKGVGGALVAGTVGLIGAGIGSIASGSLHNKFMTALDQAIASNPLLRGANKQKVVQYANSVFKFAPHVATDPNLLSSILANAIHGEGIDPMTIKTLTDLEGRYVDNSGFNPKTYV